MKLNKGFTLIELAIVIVVISTLIAGISLGNNLYQESVLRSVIIDMKRHESHYNAFKDRYGLPPGDFNQAAALWGATCATTITCNGDGSTGIDSIFFSVNSETQRAWKHLELSGIMNYQIPVLPATWTGALKLTAAPLSKVRGAGYFMAAGPVAMDPGDTNSPFMNISAVANAVFLGRESSFSALTVGALTGLQTYNLDKKFDDARVNSAGNAIGANSGFIRALNGQNTPANCSAGTTYNVLATTDSCILGYQLDRD